MARIYETVTLEEPHVTLYKRSNMKIDIEKYFCRERPVRTFIGYYKLDDNNRLTMACEFIRSDIMLIQYNNVCNVFVECDGTYQVDTLARVELDAADRAKIDQDVRRILKANEDYRSHEARFRQWQIRNKHTLVGMTPQEAVDALTEAGF